MRDLSLATYNQMVPKEGPKIVPFSVDCRTSTSQLIDLTVAESSAQIAFIQGVYIDNTQSSEPFILTQQTSRQVVVCPAGSQGYFPVLATVPTRFVAQSASGLIIPVYFYNMPMPAAVWAGGITNQLMFDANGNLLVSDTALEALIGDEGSGPGLAVNILSGGGTSSPTRTPADDTTNPSTIPMSNTYPELYNGLGWDRMRNNHDGSALSSAARTANGTSSDKTNYQSSGALFMLKITANTASAFTLTIQGKDTSNFGATDYVDLLTSADLGGMTGSYPLAVDRAAPTVANQSVGLLLPRKYRFSYAIPDGSVTFQVGVAHTGN